MSKNEKKTKIKLSKVSVFHYVRLVYRSILFLLALTWYIITKYTNTFVGVRNIITPHTNWILIIISCVYFIEMLFRIFPSKLESPGCQKQFKKNYIPTGNVNIALHDNNATIIVALLWLVLNGIFGALYMTNLIDEGILFLLCLFYSVCDMICILFFCPFQTIFLKNKCCSLCRIYNWDFAMMFTPLFFIPSVFTWTLLAMSLIILLRWEITVWLFPERFSENTNQYIKCANCTEKLCVHKKQLKSFRKSLSRYADKEIKRILSGTTLGDTYIKIEETVKNKETVIRETQINSVINKDEEE